MPTFFDYAKRSAESQVNWAEVGKEMVTFFKEEDRIRTEKKAKIDKESRDFAKILTEAPQGDYTPLNKWALQYAGDYQEARLLQDRMLKSGRLSLKDYTVMRQNGIDGTNDLFATIKGYQTEFADKMERAKNGDSQPLEVWMMENLELLNNFNDSKVVINATDGSIGISRYITDANGNRVLDKNVATTNSLKNRADARFDRFKVDENLDTFVEGLGVHVEAMKGKAVGYKTGTIDEVLSILQKTDLGIAKTYQEAETFALESMLAQNEFNTASVLTTEGIKAENGKTYTFTFDPNEAAANDNLILLQNDPNKPGFPKAVYTDIQKKTALEYLRIKARTKYDYKEGKSVYQEQQRQPRPSKAPTPKEDVTYATYWNQIRWGNAAEKAEAIQAIANSPLAVARGFRKFDLTSGNVLYVTDDKGNRLPFNLNVSNDAWSSSGAPFHGVVDKKKAVQAGGGGSRTADLSPTSVYEMTYDVGSDYEKKREGGINYGSK